LAAAAVAAVVLVLGTGCGGASKTIVVTRTVDASSAAAARAAAAAQIAAATHGAGKAGQAPSAPTPPSSASPTSTAGSAPANPAGQKAPSGVLTDADAICVRRNRELSALPANDAGRQASARAAIERRALAELSALRPPASDALAYRQVLVATRMTLGHASKAGGQGQLRLLAAAVRAGVKHCDAVD
jgi:hypothetical protein